MDIKDFIPSEDNVTVDLRIKDKNLTNADGSNMTVTVLSPFSKQYRKILQSITEERIKSKDNDDQDFDTFITQTLVDATVDWNITYGDEKPKFSKELAKEIYDKAFWIRSQIQEAQAKLSDFSIP